MTSSDLEWVNAHSYNHNRDLFIDTTRYFKLGSGWAGFTEVKPPDEKYWVLGDSIQECKQKLLKRYFDNDQ